MVMRDTISGCLFGCEAGAGNPDLCGHEIVQERCEQGVERFFAGLFCGEFLVDAIQDHHDLILIILRWYRD